MSAPGQSLRILLTNNTLAERAGSELYVRDLALALLRAGHRPVAFSTHLGEVAAEMRAATIPVVSDLRLLAEAPDLIHGHHHLDTMTALLQFEGVPAISYCHGWTPWEEAPLQFPRVLRYVAVDQTCRDRLVCEHGLPPEKVRVILNFVDGSRFPRRRPLPSRPQRALVFSNQAEDGGYAGLIREACAGSGIQVDLLGRSGGRISADPGTVLARYDLVFAKARAALEAMAVGCAVIVGDASGCGPLVTSENVQRLRQMNFGLRCLREAWTVKAIRAEIAAFDARDAERVTSFIRVDADLGRAMETLVCLYRQVIEEHRRSPPASWTEERLALAAYFRTLAPRLKLIQDRCAAPPRGRVEITIKEPECEIR
jgi:glycosyltransferase involved in cell wall biosynthesis